MPFFHHRVAQSDQNTMVAIVAHVPVLTLRILPAEQPVLSRALIPALLALTTTTSPLFRTTPQLIRDIQAASDVKLRFFPTETATRVTTEKNAVRHLRRLLICFVVGACHLPANL